MRKAQPLAATNGRLPTQTLVLKLTLMLELSTIAWEVDLSESGIIALDVGEKRVGVAATDPLGLTAQPLTVLQRKPHGLFLEALINIVKEREAGLVVLGLPKRTDGSIGPEAQRVLALAHELRTRLGLRVETSDERMTTAMANRVLDQAGLKREERLKVIDKTAAVLILEGYLTRMARAGSSSAKVGQESF